MSPARIRFGIVWRLAGILTLSVLSINTVYVTPDPMRALLGWLAILAIVPVMGDLIWSMRKLSREASFGLARVLINVAMALFALVTLGLMVGLPIWLDIILALLTAWHALMAFFRWKQFKSPNFLETLPKSRPRPSPFAPLRDFIQKQQQD